MRKLIETIKYHWGYRKYHLSNVKYYLDIKHYWMVFEDRFGLYYLRHGKFKKWVLNTVFYKEIGFARTKINVRWGDLHDLVKEKTNGELNLFTGIRLLEEGIKNEEAFQSMLKREKHCLELTKELLAEIKAEEKAEKEGK